MTWHRCLKAQVTARIQARRRGESAWVTLSVGRNRCQSALGPDVCAREGKASGEDYDLCGPPVHAEVDALDGLDVREIDFDTDEYRVLVSGHDYVCRECQQTLVKAGFTHFEIR